MARLPSILRKELRLHQARRALLRGAPEEALGFLRDPCLVLSTRAEWIRSRTLDALCRRALRRAREGRDASTARLVEMVDAEDPERADRLRDRLGPDEAPSGTEGEETLAAMRELLADLRRAAADAEPPVAPPVEPEPAPRPLERADSASAGRLLLLAVDDGGESLLARGTEFVLGHLRSRRADLPFLADVEREHVRLTRMESFHGGARWCLEANGRVELDGRVLEPREGERAGRVAELSDGQEVRLARNLAFRFRLPDPSSSSAALELLQGAECLGASRILLCVPGEGGRVRVGPGRDRHVAVGRLEHDLELHFDEGRLVLTSAAGLRTAEASSAGSEAHELVLSLPLAEAVDLAVGRAGPEGPPFGVALRPVRSTRPGESPGDPETGGVR